jgi:hypothetical protein
VVNHPGLPGPIPGPIPPPALESSDRSHRTERFAAEIAGFLSLPLTQEAAGSGRRPERSLNIAPARTANNRPRSRELDYLPAGPADRNGRVTRGDGQHAHTSRTAAVRPRRFQEGRPLGHPPDFDLFDLRLREAERAGKNGGVVGQLPARGEVIPGPGGGRIDPSAASHTSPRTRR